MHEPLNGFTKAMLIIATIGAINWGLIGFFNWNLVDAIFGGGAREETGAFSRVIYALVGLSGLVGLVRLFQHRRVNVAHRRPATV
jgi:uncharacterized protein